MAIKITPYQFYAEPELCHKCNSETNCLCGVKKRKIWYKYCTLCHDKLIMNKWRISKIEHVSFDEL